MTTTAAVMKRTTSPPTPVLVIPISLDILGEISSADEVGSRVCKPLVAVVSVGMISDTGPALDLSRTRSE